MLNATNKEQLNLTNTMTRIPWKTLSAVLLFSIFMGCSTQPEDINVDKLSTACEFTAAQLKVCIKIKEITNGRKPEELNDQEKEAVIILNNKFKDIDRAMYKKITITQMKECADYKELNSLLDGPLEPFI
jgi:hypothetical protein